ncbi:MAG: MerC domain-containing protein, partial [Betaproteobacteria bacterium]|nr:MerC domain-containing protein [Betaproteobacteria bacterium]
LSESSIFRNYSSPTILQGKNVIFGCETGQGRGGCSLEVPSIDELKNKLGTAVSSNKKNGLLSGIGSFGAALTVGLCPVCIPAIGAFLASIGLGFIVQESVLRPVLFIFLAAAISGLLWSYLKEHSNVWPLIGGILMGVTLYVGRYVYLGAVINQVLMYGGVAGIIAVCIWNLKLRKSASCPACEVKETS